MEKTKMILNILSADKAEELTASLREFAEAQATRWLATWDAETLYALVVEVFEGEPVQWHVRGPLPRDQAKVWIGRTVSEFAADRPAVRH